MPKSSQSPASLSAAAVKEGKGSRRPNPIDIHVGSRVRLQRVLLSMSQEKLGDKLGLTFQQIQKYEKGTNRTSMSRLVEIADALAVPVSLFTEGLGEHQDRDGADYTPDVIEFINSPRGVDLVETMLKLSSKQASIVVDIARSIDLLNEAERT